MDRVTCVRCQKQIDKSAAKSARWLIAPSGLVLCKECISLDGQGNMKPVPAMEGTATADIAEGASMRVARREKVIYGNHKRVL